MKRPPGQGFISCWDQKDLTNAFTVHRMDVHSPSSHALIPILQSKDLETRITF